VQLGSPDLIRGAQASLRERQGIDNLGLTLRVFARLAYRTNASVAGDQRRFSGLSNWDGHCVEAIDSVGEEHPEDHGAEKAEYDSSGCARTLIEVLLGGIVGFDSG
jgi:hypothetical protein